MKVHWIEHYWNDKNQMVANMTVVHNILNGGVEVETEMLIAA